MHGILAACSGGLPYESPLVDVVAGTLVDSNLASPSWVTLDPTHAPAIRALTISDPDFDPTTPIYFVNYNRASPVFGVFCCDTRNVPNGTTGHFECDVKLAPSDTTERFFYGAATTPALAALVGGSTGTVTATSSWVHITGPAVAQTSVTNPQALPYFKCNDTVNAPTTTSQARFLVRNMRWVPAASSGDFASTLTRVSAYPSNWHDAGTSTSLAFAKYGSAGQTAWQHYPLSRQCLVAQGSPAFMVLEVYSTLDPVVYPNQAQVSVLQGASRGNMSPIYDSGAITLSSVTYLHVPLTAGRYIDIINGNTLDGSGLVTIRAVYFPAGTTLTMLAPPTNVLLVTGDSLAGSFFTTAPRLGWINQLRYLVPITTGIVSRSGGGRTVGSQASSPGAAAAEAAKCAVYGAGQSYLVELITNDFGGPGAGMESAATFGTYDASLADALHTADPTGRVLGLKPFKRTDEANANTFGNILADYTAQRATVYGTRSYPLIDGHVALPTFPGYADGIHFTDANSATIAANMPALLRAAGVPGF